MQEYKGVKFEVRGSKVSNRHNELYIWNNLVQQYVFERSLRNNNVAEDAIEQIIFTGECYLLLSSSVGRASVC